MRLGITGGLGCIRRNEMKMKHFLHVSLAWKAMSSSDGLPFV